MTPQKCTWLAICLVATMSFGSSRALAIFPRWWCCASSPPAEQAAPAVKLRPRLFPVPVRPVFEPGGHHKGPGGPLAPPVIDLPEPLAEEVPVRSSRSTPPRKLAGQPRDAQPIVTASVLKSRTTPATTKVAKEVEAVDVRQEPPSRPFVAWFFTPAPAATAGSHEEIEKTDEPTIRATRIFPKRGRQPTLRRAGSRRASTVTHNLKSQWAANPRAVVSVSPPPSTRESIAESAGGNSVLSSKGPSPTRTVVRRNPMKKYASASGSVLRAAPRNSQPVAAVDRTANQWSPRRVSGNALFD